MRKPTPKTIKVECSLCGLDWTEHEKLAKKAKRKWPNQDDCVTLLKAELAKPKRTFSWQGVTSSANSPQTTWAVSGPNQRLYQ